MDTKWFGDLTALYALACPFATYYLCKLIKSWRDDIGWLFYVLVALPILFGGYLAIRAIQRGGEDNEPWVITEGYIVLVLAIAELIVAFPFIIFRVFDMM